MQIALRAGDDVLARWGNAVGALGEYEARRVMARALNRTGGPTYTGVVRALRDQTSAPVRVIKTQVKLRKAWAGTAAGQGKLQVEITASGRRIPLKWFHPRETKAGVRARVWGRTEVFEGAFMRGGPWGARVEFGREGMRGRVFERDGKARTPIAQVFGPSLPKEMGEGRARDAFVMGVRRLPNDVAHEMRRVLPV